MKKVGSNLTPSVDEVLTELLNCHFMEDTDSDGKPVHREIRS